MRTGVSVEELESSPGTSALAREEERSSGSSHEERDVVGDISGISAWSVSSNTIGGLFGVFKLDDEAALARLGRGSLTSMSSSPSAFPEDSLWFSC